MLLIVVGVVTLPVGLDAAEILRPAAGVLGATAFSAAVLGAVYASTKGPTKSGRI